LGERLKNIELKEVIFTLGFIALATGLAGYDWRISASVSGAILLFLAVFPAFLPYFAATNKGKP